MKTKIIKISEIAIDGGSLEHIIKMSEDFALSPDDIRSHPWEGIAVGESSVVLAAINESQKFPSYFHCRVFSHSASETKMPVIAEAVGLMIESLLVTGRHDTSVKEMKWMRSDLILDAVPQNRRITPGEIVYFLRAGEFIKIGKATGDPLSRVSQLKTGCPFPIEVVATMPGGYREEGDLHNRFQHIRAHGEWFHATLELCAYIETISKEISA